MWQVIDDDHITSHEPQFQASEPAGDATYSTALIKLARTISSVTRRLTSVETCRPSPEALTSTMLTLEDELEELKGYLGQFVDLDAPLRPLRHDTCLDLQQALYLCMSYYIIVFEIYSPVTYPWAQRSLDVRSSKLTLQKQIQKSITLTAKTARNAILATQFLQVDATSSILYGSIFA